MMNCFGESEVIVTAVELLEKNNFFHSQSMGKFEVREECLGVGTWSWNIAL